MNLTTESTADGYKTISLLQYLTNQVKPPLKRELDQYFDVSLSVSDGRLERLAGLAKLLKDLGSIEAVIKYLRQKNKEVTTSIEEDVHQIWEEEMKKAKAKKVLFSTPVKVFTPTVIKNQRNLPIPFANDTLERLMLS